MTSTVISNPELPTGITSYRLIRESCAAKLGMRSSGKIVFQILTDDAHQDLFVRIAANEGGGYVSDEVVSVHALVRCITERASSEPLRSGIFKSAFVGKSSNNSGFMTAVLLHEGLLSRDANRPHLLIDCGFWNDWRATQLSISGDLPVVRVGKEPALVTDSGSGDVPDDIADPAHIPEDDDTPRESEPEPIRPARKGRKGRMLELE
jgi:hypothetical protein